jgi:hypothetical protein
MPSPAVSRAGMLDYLKHALVTPWNLLVLVGGAAAALLSPWPDVLLPLLGAGELLYLGALVSLPRFREAVDAQLAAGARAAQGSARQRSVFELLTGLPADAQQRFTALRRRCLEMRSIAQAARPESAAETIDLWTPALDRLLYGFLRLLGQQNSMRRFLGSTTSAELKKRLEDLKKKLPAAQAAGDDRVTRSLEESVTIAEQRVENYEKAEKNAEFAAIELDRVETKIQALIELAANRQDNSLLSSQVDAAAESMHRTEATLSQLQQFTGVTDELDEVPAILDQTKRTVTDG